MKRFRLSRDVSFHLRGEDLYSFHGLTGDVCGMSRDVAALCMAFTAGGGIDAIAATGPCGLAPARAAEFARILASRLVLVPTSRDERADAAALWDLLARRRPYVPRMAIYERRGADAIVYGRAVRETLVDGARVLEGCDGRRPLSEVCRRDRAAPLLRLCRPDLAALKLLPDGGGVPPWAESTMPWPAVALPALVGQVNVRDEVGEGAAAREASRASDLGEYHARIADADAQFDDTETTLSHLFRDPHPSLDGERFGDRLARALVARGLAPASARVVEVGGGLGYLGRALVERLAPRSYLIVDRSPALAAAQRSRGLSSVVGDALHLPIESGSVDLLVSNEMAGDLGSDESGNFGALSLLDECARVLAPGGLAYISEFGHPRRPPVRSDHLDHDEYSIRFGDLEARARERELACEVLPLPRLIGLAPEAEALVTTRASYAALRSLFRAHGAELPKRAWLRSELDAHAALHGLDLSSVHGLATAAIGDRTMGLVPREFWALIAKKRAA